MGTEGTGRLIMKELNIAMNKNQLLTSLPLEQHLAQGNWIYQEGRHPDRSFIHDNLVDFLFPHRRDKYELFSAHP